METKVSIIIAAYNIENYIERCLESVVNQTFKYLEIIVVNDGSTDNTLKKIEKFKNNDERIIIVNKKNRGLIEARKSGFKVASGEYILFIDGDDWLDTKAIETLYKIAKNDNYDIIQYGYLIAFENGTFKNGFNYKEEKNFINDEFLDVLLKGKINHMIWCKFIKREYIQKNNITFPSNVSFGEDLAFSVSLAVNNPNIYVIKDWLYYYYKRNTSLMNNISPKMLEIYDVTMFIKKILINNGVFEKYIEEFEYMAYMQNYYLRIDLIYLYENDIGKEMFNRWKSLNINIKNNKYYKELYNREKFKARVIARICEKNYFLGKFIYKCIVAK